MTVRKMFFLMSLILLVLCLVAGYAIAGHWFGAVPTLLMGPAWWLARKHAASGLPLVCLLASVGFAVAGRLIGSPPLLMIFASTLSLAVWDLVLLDSALGKNDSVEPTRRYENSHLRSLLLALGAGLFAILFGRFLNIELSFFVLLLFVAFLLFALDRVFGYIKKTR